jgi:hypothetical protein
MREELSGYNKQTHLRHKEQDSGVKDSTDDLALCEKYLPFWFQSSENQAFGTQYVPLLKSPTTTLETKQWKTENFLHINCHSG